MGKITYNLSDFNGNKAKQGSLVVAIDKDYYVPETRTTIDNITKDDVTYTWGKTTGFLGAGVCKLRGNIYVLTVDSVDYEFNEDGLGTNICAKDYVLMMGTIDTTVVSVGNTVSSTTTNITTRGRNNSRSSVPTVDITTVTDAVNSNVVIDYMTVRDQFAVHALRSILAQVKDPSSVSDSVMSQLCEVAYQWAANMMAAAANARAELVDETASDYVTEAEVGSFENNTEKLLNNIWSALTKTDVEETVQVGNNTQTIYSERTVNPTLNQLLESLQETISSKKYQRVLVKDVDTLATKLDTLNTTLGTINTTLGTIKTAIEGVATAIGNLQLSPTINNNIIVPEPEAE